jgi:hypothetical protein
MSTDNIPLSNINFPQRAKNSKRHAYERKYFLAPTAVLAASHCFEKTSFTRFFSLSRNWLKWATSDIPTAGLVVF